MRVIGISMMCAMARDVYSWCVTLALHVLELWLDKPQLSPSTLVMCITPMEKMENVLWKKNCKLVNIAFKFLSGQFLSLVTLIYPDFAISIAISKSIWLDLAWSHMKGFDVTFDGGPNISWNMKTSGHSTPGEDASRCVPLWWWMKTFW